MAITEIFSKRSAKAAAAKNGVQDVYRYDVLPQRLRVQVVHIWDRTLGRNYGSETWPAVDGWARIEQRVCEEYGLFRLGADEYEPESYSRCVAYFVNGRDVERGLDLIEVTFAEIQRHYSGRAQVFREAIADLNYRFREHSVGYQLENGQIVQVDSQLLHAEVVKPALTLLNVPGFAGPQEEFLKAHEHYRAANNKDAIVSAARAFESTLKAICKARRWSFDPDKDTAHKLVDIVIKEGLLPAFLTNELSGLRAVLETAVPTTRNRTSGHGQGAEPIDVPDHMVAYVLHATAANIVMLVQAHEALK